MAELGSLASSPSRSAFCNCPSALNDGVRAKERTRTSTTPNEYDVGGSPLRKRAQSPRLGRMASENGISTSGRRSIVMAGVEPIKKTIALEKGRVSEGDKERCDRLAGPPPPSASKFL